LITAITSTSTRKSGCDSRRVDVGGEGLALHHIGPRRAAFIKAEAEKWSRVVKAAGLKVD